MGFFDSLFGKKKHVEVNSKQASSRQTSHQSSRETARQASTTATSPLKKWTKTISTQTIYKKSISFHVDRFEEWQGGQCINRGNLNFDLHLIVRGDNISVDIPEHEKFRIHHYANFPFMGSDVLEDRVQYVDAPGASTDPTKPIVLHIFVKNGKIDYIRFAMSFPDRIVEFYGYQVESKHSTPDDFNSLNSSSNSSKDYKLTFLASLVKVASCDGEISNEEMQTLVTFLQREGLSDADFMRVITNPSSIPQAIPQSPALRAQHIRDAVMLSMVDGNFHPKEYALCQEIAISLGFHPDVIDVIRQEVNSLLDSDI